MPAEFSQELAGRLRARLDAAAAEADALSARLADPACPPRAAAGAARRLRTLRPLADGARRLADLDGALREAEGLLAAGDPELAQLAREQLAASRAEADALLHELAARLVGAEDAAVDALYLELRAGTGGAEAALFAGELMAAYQAYAKRAGFSFELLDLAEGEAGGLRHGLAALRGPGCYAHLGYESGVHQVKRVPATETQGRIHTSACTVVVLPEPDEDAAPVAAAEVKEELYCAASGPGGQNVNKVATAVRLTHLPTGLEVRVSESRSQGSNRERAWKLLRARVAERRREEAERQRQAQRRGLMGSGGRADKIRVYRFKDNILKDDRVDGEFKVSEAMAGRLEPLVAALQAADFAARIAAL